MASNREIKALSDFEHVITRPTMYVGQVAKTDIKIPVIESLNGESYIKKKEIIASPAFYKLYDEVLGNAFDEAIRVKGKLKEITIGFDSKTNVVTVTDSGGGFFKGTEINEKTGLTNIETAFTRLKAGSNFDDTREDEVIGTNGVGVSLVNMLSDWFEVETTNDEYKYTQRWTRDDWNNNKQTEYTIEDKKKSWKTGTIIKFKPASDLFRGNHWDKEYINTLMVLKNFIKNEDPLINKVNFKAFFDGKELDLNTSFIPKEHVKVESPIGKIWFYPSQKDSLSLSFVNGQMCEGTHQRIIAEDIDENIFGYQYAHWWFSTIITLNLKPNLVKFADQNKTKFATGKWEIFPILKRSFFAKLKIIKQHKKIFNVISKKIEEYQKINAVKDLNKAKKKARDKTVQILSKYYPPSGKKEVLFISEGLSASGGLIQSRDTKRIGVYALRGKIKNTRNISDLADSQEIVQLMNILGLSLDSKECDYERIIIATDADTDGHHISSLLINLFYKWFPFLIEQDRLYILDTPVITAKVDNKLTHFYNSKEFYESKFKKVNDKTYIKGLGALDPDDWKLIFSQINLLRIYGDRSAKKLLNIAFGSDAKIRKKWLENKL